MFHQKIFDLLNDAETQQQAVENNLQKQINSTLDDSKAFQKAIVDAEGASEYGADDDIYRWFRVGMLSDIDARLRPFVETYLSDYGIDVDWDSVCFKMYCFDNIIIQIGSRQYSGIYQEGSLIIDSDEYTIDGEVDMEKRAFLIEQYMEKTGCYPDIVTLDCHNNVFPVSNTQKLAAAYKDRRYIVKDWAGNHLTAYGEFTDFESAWGEIRDRVEDEADWGEYLVVRK